MHARVQGMHLSPLPRLPTKRNHPMRTMILSAAIFVLLLSAAIVLLLNH